MTWICGGPTCLDAKSILEAIDHSLMRMRTDYIDLQQIHWPDRYVPMFGETKYDPSQQLTSVPIEEQLDAFGRAVDAGDALYAFRRALKDPGNVLQSWDPTLVNPCTWFHVTCDVDNRVMRLDLGNAGLSGTLVPELGRLEKL